MTESGLVSVILPNRDHGDYLPTAIESFLAQTRPQLEIIVIDDASSDNSKEIIRDYMARDRRIQLVELKEHHGINRAVGVGLKWARGEYLHFSASDDFVAVNLIEQCVAQLERHPQAALCFSDPSEFYRDNNRAILFPLYLSVVPVYFDCETLKEQLSRNFFHISANTAVYRADLFRAAGGYRAELEWFSDWFVTIVASLRHGACYVPAQLTYVTIRPDSYSARSLRNWSAQRRLIEIFLNVLGRPEYADVYPVMRNAALMPEYHVRTVFWLLRNEAGRRFMTLRLVRRALGRYLWSLLRPFVPSAWRRAMRQFSSSRMC